MDIEIIKEELSRFSSIQLECIFKEVISKKRKEEFDQKRLHSEIDDICKALQKICIEGEKHRKSLKLFEMIGCETEKFVFSSDKIIDNLTIEQIMHDYKNHNKQRFSINETEKENKYISELHKCFLKYGDKIRDPNYLKIIRNSFISRKILSGLYTEKMLLNDINDRYFDGK